MIARDLDEHDGHSVGVLDPHLVQPPRLSSGFTGHCHARRDKTFVLNPYVTDLQPDPQRSAGLVVGRTGYLEESLAKEEDQPRIFGRSELAVDRKSEDVAVETATTHWVGRAKQYAAAEYFHDPIIPGLHRLGYRNPQASPAWSPRRGGRE
jgi:hypothetical protein